MAVSGAKSPGALTSRRGAVALIRRALEQGEMLEEAALPGAFAPHDRARALSLARASMRWLGPVNAVLSRFMKRPPAPEGHAILLLAGTELLALGEAAHGAVDAAVRLAKSDPETERLSGLANAVLRRVAEEGPAIWADLDHARLATPDWLWKALRADWGRSGAAAIAAAHLKPAATDLTAKNGDGAALAAQVGGETTPTGSVRLTRPGRLTGLDGYDAGAWWAQDAAAALPARLAGAGTRRRALDLCAAPGGKTMQLAAAGWRVTALDASSARMKRVEENLARTGLAAALVTADALEWRPEARFDLVLLDAPCTATGTIRRHPELPHIRDGEGLGAATALQERLLDAAWEMTAPGGRLIYCACSLNRAEGEARINTFLKTRPDAARAPIAAEEIGDADLVTRSGDLRARPDFWPEIGGMDGFFAARLTRAA